MKMQIRFATLVMAAHVAWGTQVPYRELSSIVRESDHVIIGTVTNVLVHDQHGNLIADRKAATGRNGNDMRMFVHRDPSGLLKSTKTDVPTELQIDYGGIFFLQLYMEQEGHIGKTYIFLLKGDDFSPTYHMLSFRPLEERPQIEQLLNEEKAQPTGGAYGSPEAGSPPAHP